jgi:hypothetical protein
LVQDIADLGCRRTAFRVILRLRDDALTSVQATGARLSVNEAIGFVLPEPGVRLRAYTQLCY